MEIEADNHKNPGSIFIMGPSGFCMEFDKMELVRVVKIELGLVELVSTGAERFLASI